MEKWILNPKERKKETKKHMTILISIINYYNASKQTKKKGEYIFQLNKKFRSGNCLIDLEEEEEKKIAK